ncbi:MAG: hypothetical protein KJ947_10425 [Alphaproteobacteria bacterium]|nr:hypothetical protein [Alphaproteobacteria bacterium]MBU1549974.1 hypothetical protein [Alphaproteobacteria bacterium]MBU2336570.1 hypothetical protein [Alphaproteobacteria bacterium]MBU2387303.1 hypothetical protein [Alphaproteobacteria bacterium]
MSEYDCIRDIINRVLDDTCREVDGCGNRGLSDEYADDVLHVVVGGILDNEGKNGPGTYVSWDPCFAVETYGHAHLSCQSVSEQGLSDVYKAVGKVLSYLILRSEEDQDEAA